jgi:predicted nucleic acid-binding protein
MEIYGLDKILVDTSVLIEYFRKKDPLYSTVNKLIDEDRICCTGLVLAELIQGARSRDEIKALKDFTYVFSFLEESANLWEKAGELSFELKKAGQQIGLADCYIAAAASKSGVAILTLDDHFTLIQRQLKITLL